MSYLFRQNPIEYLLNQKGHPIIDECLNALGPLVFLMYLMRQ